MQMLIINTMLFAMRCVNALRPQHDDKKCERGRLVIQNTFVGFESSAVFGDLMDRSGTGS